MVLQRHIDKLKERPHHERRAVALTIALCVIVILFIGWAFIFFTDLHATVQSNAQAQAALQAQEANTSTTTEQ